MPLPRLVPPFLVVALLIGFLLLRAALFSITTNSEYALYFDYAREANTSTLAKLHQKRDIEYPPLATLFGVAVLHVAEALPDGTEVLTAWRPNASPGPAWARYEVALGLVLFAADVACLLLISFIARHLYPDDGPWQRFGRLGLYVAATTALGLILYDRQDLVVGLVATLAVAAFARGWPLAAYAVLAAGVAYKLVPVLLVPLWVLAFAAARARSASAGRFAHALVREGVAAGAILALVPALMYLCCGRERAFVFLSFHATRGLQLESSLGWLVFVLEPGTLLGHSYGSYTLRGDLADCIARATTLLTAMAAMVSVIVSVRGFQRIENPCERVTHLVASSLLVWLGFILCTKVGSPQYLLWLAPLVPLLPLRPRSADRYWAALLFAGMVVTTLIFPCLYEEVKGERRGDELLWAGPTAIGLVLLAAKSILLGAAFIWLAVLVWRGRWA